MLNYIWVGMIIVGIVCGLITGRMEQVTEAVIASSEEGVNLAILLTGVMCLWSGLMKIAQKSGMVNAITRATRDFFAGLFTGIPENHPATGAIVLSFTANLLGLGNAATPLGIKAMESLQTLNEKKDTATDDMILFMVINASCIQLIPTSVIVLRDAAGSVNPASIIPHVWISSLISTVTAILFYFIFRSFDKRRG
ncbi:spore maturation protein A [Thermoclostridium stercorarium subsp. stercorarium DSM 8532]|jgi:spore maturation protein A|uniref:Spore maturation protein A n=3 Tax=Thermoclostridium stercorarium TaxID=1510 RepID=L7VP02_THES1|nr:nucleoside recognition domain-containing protein [Thermoclostridium stercorarium]AGC68161.1 spore maturation protein A [Thermoclostridium stercorarium subsp. stercorarium DSM 8532]AGI39188.1 membrane protein [Thermoclostridium stercorarium subsp. stercorarium DSM 8532]ANW98533.1 nucleoside recognition protein [Thermoclostridium stercorarium subsp. thermolacticum DSM 2910]ANX01068.1 nucleoside recognition protein [Thermoclostridium stercorarium subsp. leptospartum DSM 9219]UZQ86686.1 nucleos